MAYQVIKDGTSQDDRLARALEEGYFNIDELSLADLLSMVTEYSKILKFYNINNEHAGDWENFFTNDDSVILSMILTFDLERVENEFNEFNNTIIIGSFLADFPREIENIPNCVLACKLDLWLKKVHALAESDTAWKLGEAIDSIISEKLVVELQSLKLFLGYRKGVVAESFCQDFDGVWFIKSDQRAAGAYSDFKIDDDDFIKSNFFEFHSAISFLKKTARDLLESSLKTKSHNPAIGLYIAFLKLYKKVQERHNRYTKRHLKFYYEDILKVQERPVTPDSTYLLFTQKGELPESIVEEGTAFLAGKDDDDNDVVYEACNDLILNRTKVAALYTLNMERNSLSFPEKDLITSSGRKFISGAKFGQISVFDKPPKPGGNESSSYPLFGAPKESAEQGHLKHPLMGFALASPVLLLKEGQRDISISFDSLGIDKKIEELCKNILKKEETKEEEAKEGSDPRHMDIFFKVFRHMFELQLTTESGWYDVQEYIPLYSKIDEQYPDDLFKIQVRLSHNVPPIVPYSAEIHGGMFDTDMPVMRFVVAEGAYLAPYSLLKDILIGEINIEVSVRGARDLLLYNNLGKLKSDGDINPFGPMPGVGSSFIVSSEESARKHLSHFELQVEWGDLPTNKEGFEGYYKEYGLDYDDNIFEASVSALSGGKWRPNEKDNTLYTIKLFDSEGSGHRLGGSTGIKKSSTFSCDDLLRFSGPIEETGFTGQLDYNSQTKDGFFRFTLSSPEYAFGHKTYPDKLTSVLTMNARLKRKRLLKPLPKA
ncbi:MAG: hypothetical protein V3T30_00180, partial [Thermodesulfobacteriota bacterium]